MSEKWLKAAAKYNTRRSGVLKLVRSAERAQILLLSKFMRSPEWKEAKALLSASSFFIVLGTTGPMRKVHITLSSRGFELRVGDDLKRISVAKAGKEIMKLLNEKRSSGDFKDIPRLTFPLAYIRDELDNIADNAP